MGRLEFELTYYESVVQWFNDYTTRTTPGMLKFTDMKPFVNNLLFFHEGVSPCNWLLILNFSPSRANYYKCNYCIFQLEFNFIWSAIVKKKKIKWSNY